MKETSIRGIGRIPSEWDMVKLRMGFSFAKGLSITKDDLVDDGIPVISYGQVHAKDNPGTGIVNSLLRYVPESFLARNKTCLVQPGDFIFADTSEDYMGIGNAVFVDRNERLFAGYHSIIARPVFTSMYPKYYAYWFLTDCWRDQIRANVMGVKVFSITQLLLRDTFMLVPPVKEQEKIVEYLDGKCAKLDEIIETIEKQIEILQKQKRSIISRAVIKGISRNVAMKDSGIPWLGHIPSHWRINRLKYCCSVKTGPFGTQLSADEYTETGTPIVNVKNIGYGNIIDEDLDYIPDEVKKRLSVHILQAGDIVFGRKGAVDKHAIIDERHEGWVQGSDCMRLRIYGDIVPEFLNYYFGSSGYSYYVLSSSVGSTMASVNSQILNDSIVVYPEIDEQRRIVQYLDLAMGRIDAILERKKAQLLALRNYKRTVIYEYVTGKKRVKEVQQDAHQS